VCGVGRHKGQVERLPGNCGARAHRLAGLGGGKEQRRRSGRQPNGAIQGRRVSKVCHET
jgi:hypothetical protein